MPESDRPWDRGDNRDDGDEDRPRRRREEDDDDRPRRRRREYDDESPAASNGLATVGLVLGILSLCIGPLLGLPAAICSGIALGRPGRRGAAMTGLIMGIIGTVIVPIILIALLLPAVQKVRSAASRMADQNNLKQLSLASMSDMDRNGQGLYAPYAHDERGTIHTGLSFRVSLLPYVEQQNLYRQFDLTQAWDSPRNRPHSNTIVKTFNAPFDPEPGTNTPYRVFVGGGALFNEDGKPVRIGDVADGTSNTVMYVHAAERVPWAKPQELIYSPTDPLPALGSPAMNGTNVAMADGSVRFITKDVSERTLRAAITRAGGEVLGSDW